MGRVIVTRPAREAQEWVRGLAAVGLDAVSLPLIEIRPVADASGVVAAWEGISSRHAVMFVSGNAASAFMAVRPAVAAACAWPRAWATGPGTRAALVEAGWPEGLIDSPDAGAGNFDSEALWQLVGAGVQPGAQVLIVRGIDAGNGSLGRGWL
ncbi:MAG: uroporphyrinogen-III synthase, partial [Burkholderiaceae bacterium]